MQDQKKLLQLSCFTYLDSEKCEHFVIALQRPHLALRLEQPLWSHRQQAPSYFWPQSCNIVLEGMGPKPGNENKIIRIISALINTAGKENLFCSNALQILFFSLYFISVYHSSHSSEHSQVPLTWANGDLFFSRVFCGNIWAPSAAKWGQHGDAVQNINVKHKSSRYDNTLLQVLHSSEEQSTLPLPGGHYLIARNDQDNRETHRYKMLS